MKRLTEVYWLIGTLFCLFIGLPSSTAQKNILESFKTGEIKYLGVECVKDTISFKVLEINFDKSGDLESTFTREIENTKNLSMRYYERLESDTLVWYKSENWWVSDTMKTYRKMEIVSDSVLMDSIFYTWEDRKDTAIKSYVVTKRAFGFQYPLYLMTGKELAKYYGDQKESYEVKVDSNGSLTYFSSKLTQRIQTGCVITETHYSKRFSYNMDGTINSIETNRNGRIIEKMKMSYKDGLPSVIELKNEDIGDYVLKITYNF